MMFPSLVAAREALRRREVSSVELTQAHLDAIERLNPVLNAFITVTPEVALRQAAAADVARVGGADGAMLGLPVANKDLFCTEGTRTTAASLILEPFVPPYESTVTANLLRDGAVFLGKTKPRRVCHGVFQHELGVRAGDEPVDAGRRREAGAGGVIRWVGGGGCGGAGAGGNGDGHGRVYPAAGFVLGDCRHEADLWAVFAVGGGGVCLEFGPSRAFGADGGGLRGDAGEHGRVRCEGQHECRAAGAGFRGGLWAGGEGAAGSGCRQSIEARGWRPK